MSTVEVQCLNVDLHKTNLLLWVDADHVPAGPSVLILDVHSRREVIQPHLLRHTFSEVVHTQGLNQPHQPCLLAVFSGPIVPARICKLKMEE